jgi:hypothetical protein
LLDRSGKVRVKLTGYDEKSLQMIADAIVVLLSEPPQPPVEPKAKH